MKVSGDLQFKVLLGVIALAGAGYVLYRVSKAAAEVAGAAAQAVNPFNNDNIINQGATSIYQGATGSTGTIGTDLYDWMHPEYVKYNGQGKPPETNDSGWDSWSIGTKIYDWTH
jgi:Flp pilus assembly protein TadG